MELKELLELAFDEGFEFCSTMNIGKSEHFEQWYNELDKSVFMFSENQMEKAFNDGAEAEEQRCGNFDIENYI